MRDDLRRGARFALAAAAAFAVMAACIKGASAASTTEMVVFFRCVTSLVLLLPWVLRRGGAVLRTERMASHVWRSLLGIAAMYAFFHALAHLQLATALLLTYSTPLYLPFIAWLWIGERPAALAFPAAVLGLLGIALIVKPGADFFQPAALAGIASGMLAAAAMVSIRRMSDTEPAVRIVFYFALLASLVSAVPLLWAWASPSATTLLLLLGTGVFATLGQLFLTRAYALAPAAQIGPFTYTAVIFAGLLGWLLWAERPDLLSLAGMALVLGCCVLVSWRRLHA